jgi:hypothetical protein
MQIILHIGQQKTASTAIQACLAQNRKQLAAQRVLYPRAFGHKKSTIIKEFVSDDPSLGESRETIVSNFRAELTGNYNRIIFSDENLFIGGGGGRIPRLLKDAFGQYATSWRVLCYIRRPDEHIASFYQQKVKGPYVNTFGKFFDEQLQDQTYNYSKFIDKWSNVFGKDALEVRVFHRKTLKGSPVNDFIQWVGLDPESLSFDPEEHANESLDRVNTEILRLLHVCMVERPDLFHRNDLKPNIKPMIRRLRALDTGERLRLDTARAKLLHERFREDHERVAERYLTPEDAAILLAPPSEIQPPPPIDREVLASRIMALFNDPDLAQFAMQRAEQPTELDRIPATLVIPPRQSEVARAVKQFDQNLDGKSARTTEPIARQLEKKRTNKSLINTIAKMFKIR